MGQIGGEHDVRIRRKRISNFPCYDSIVQTSPQKSKGHGKLSIHYCADQETIETIFRIIVFANQLSLYGAVAEICEEYESLHEKTHQPVVRGQSSSSFVPNVIKSPCLWIMIIVLTMIFYCTNTEKELTGNTSSELGRRESGAAQKG